MVKWMTAGMGGFKLRPRFVTGDSDAAWGRRQEVWALLLVLGEAELQRPIYAKFCTLFYVESHRQR